MNIEMTEDTMRALNRYVGFSGCGPSLLDEDYRDPTEEELKIHAVLISEEKKIRADSWKAAKLEVLGDLDGL